MTGSVSSTSERTVGAMYFEEGLVCPPTTTLAWLDWRTFCKRLRVGGGGGRGRGRETGKWNRRKREEDGGREGKRNMRMRNRGKRLERERNAIRGRRIEEGKEEIKKREYIACRRWRTREGRGRKGGKQIEGNR